MGWIMFWFLPQYFFCSFCVPEHESKLPTGSASANLWILDKNRFIKNHTYIWVGKNLDIVASSIISTSDTNKIQNDILKLTWFHTPASYFLLNGHDTMGYIVEQNLAMTYSFQIFGGSFLPVYCLKYWPNTISRKLPVKATSRVHFIYPKVRVWVVVKELKKSWKCLYKP